MQVMALLVEIQKDMSANATKVDRLISDVANLTSDVRSLGTTLSLAKGAAFAALVLIPICAGIVWWLIGGQLESIRDQILAAPQPAHTAAPPPDGN